MNVSIIAVGTELLFGQTLNTNATYLSNKMNLMGFNVLYHFVVGDNEDRLKAVIGRAMKDTDILIFTGGLGPTQDDLTKETVAQVFGVPLDRDEKCLEEIKEFFQSRGRQMAENNYKQADLPRGSVAFHNSVGTAPGFGLEVDGKVAICLPGPPREMKWMFENRAVDFLQKFSHRNMYYKVIRTIGIGESDLETALLPLIDTQDDPTIATYAKEGECTLRVASQRDSIHEAVEAVDQMCSRIENIIGEYIYSTEDKPLNQVVVEKLINRGLTLSSAESCTGGLFASEVTDIPGASAVFGRGLVTYSPEEKVKLLGVSKETLEKYSVVSRETAVEMARGVRTGAGSHISVSVTGVAGPGPSDGFPAGTAYIGYSFQNKEGSVEIRTGRDDRKWNRNYFVLRMFKVINEILDGKMDEKTDRGENE